MVFCEDDMSRLDCEIRPKRSAQQSTADHKTVSILPPMKALGTHSFQITKMHLACPNELSIFNILTYDAPKMKFISRNSGGKAA
jgi:hypothetical protein